MPKQKKFDPEGSGFDIDTALAAGMIRDSVRGHYGSVVPASEKEREEHKLPKGSFLMLKGKKHKSWKKGVEGEENLGRRVIKKGKRYFAIPAGDVLYGF